MSKINKVNFDGAYLRSSSGHFFHFSPIFYRCLSPGQKNFHHGHHPMSSSALSSASLPPYQLSAEKSAASEWNSNPAHMCGWCWCQRLGSWNFCLFWFSSPSSVQVRRAGMVKVNKVEDKWVACGIYGIWHSCADFSIGLNAGWVLYEGPKAFSDNNLNSTSTQSQKIRLTLNW